MRKVYLGKFADYKPAGYGKSYDPWDSSYDLIGGHIAVRYERERVSKTVGLEYYIKDENGKNVRIKDATTLEKIMARIKYIFNSNNGKVVGYRSDKISDLSRPGYSLGSKFDESSEKWKVDKEYYESKGYVNGTKINFKRKERRTAKGYFREDRGERD